MEKQENTGAKKWREVSRRTLLETKVFTVIERTETMPNGKDGKFTVLECPDWATVVPVMQGPEGLLCLMVRQYRIGTQDISIEFPGGVIEAGESPLVAAARELAEETAYTAGRLIPVGSVSPNCAIQANRFHVFLALDLTPSGAQDLDENEFVDVLTVPLAEVREKMGTGSYNHALMASALFYADRELKKIFP